MTYTALAQQALSNGKSWYILGLHAICLVRGYKCPFGYNVLIAYNVSNNK